MLILCVLSAALLVFFAAAAGAGLVSADLGLFQPNLFYFSVALRGLGGGSLSLSHCELAHLVVDCLTYIPDTLRSGAGFQAYLKDNIRNPVLDSFEHLVEHSKAFAFIFGLGVFFSKGSKVNTVFQMVHRI